MHATIPSIPDDTATEHAGAVLRIDLDAIVANYQTLAERVRTARCGAVLKADAYGLGACRVAPALARAGCATFFVAHLHEAITVRPVLPPEAEIFVLHGPLPGSEAAFLEYDAMPVLNSLQQVKAWNELCIRYGRPLPAALQFDTGMSRMGMSVADLDLLLLDAAALHAIDIRLVMSHLACADEPDEALNAVQLERFRAVRERFPGVPVSLANSAGIFLGTDFHFDLVRPGAALFGLRVSPAARDILPTVSLHAKVIQTHTVKAGEYVGYGKRYQALSPRRLATLSVGYADGVHRMLTNRGRFYVDGKSVPVVGTVSMDSVTIDVTGIDAAHLRPGAEVEWLGSFQSIDSVAADAGTIGYETLTSLRNRFRREYAESNGD